MALKALFGLDYETLSLKAVGVQDDKLEVLSRISSILEHIPEVDVSNISSGSTKSSSQEVTSYDYRFYYLSTRKKNESSEGC